MKTNNTIITALLMAVLIPISATSAKGVEVIVGQDNNTVTKSVMVTQQLDDSSISQLKATGNVKIIRLGGLDAEIGDVMAMSNLVDANHIQISVNTDGDKTTKTVIMNGKELSVDEIAELEASGKLKSLNIDTSSVGASSMHKVMYFDTGEFGSASGKQTLEISTEIMSMVSGGATLGFMSNIKKDGWHIISVIKDSGAEEAGLIAGDIVKFMGDMELSSNTDTVFEQITKKPNYKEGEMVDLEIERNGKLLYISIEARKNDSGDMMLHIDMDEIENTIKKFKFISIDDFNKLDSPNIAKNSFIHLNGQSIDLGNLKINLPEILGNMNIFIADGNSTSKLLGKNHEMSTLSSGLAKYFGTDKGVLMMHIDDDNVFGLKDGDVIKSIDGVSVTTPKDVIKQLLKVQKQEAMKLKIVRHKRNKTLKYNK